MTIRYTVHGYPLEVVKFPQNVAVIKISNLIYSPSLFFVLRLYGCDLLALLLHPC